jgi:hypothetical protein
MPAPVGRRAGQPSRVAGNARERRYSEAVACAGGRLLRSGLEGRRRRSGRSATSWTGVRSRRTLWLWASLAGDGQCARWLESLSRCRMGHAGAVSSALPWVARHPPNSARILGGAVWPCQRWVAPSGTPVVWRGERRWPARQCARGGGTAGRDPASQPSAASELGQWLEGGCARDADAMATRPRMVGGTRTAWGWSCKILGHCKGAVSGARSLANGAADHGLTQIRVPLSCTFLACLTLRHSGGGMRSAFIAPDLDDQGPREPPLRSPARVQSNG